MWTNVRSVFGQRREVIERRPLEEEETRNNEALGWSYEDRKHQKGLVAGNIFLVIKILRIQSKFSTHAKQCLVRALRMLFCRFFHIM